MTIIPMICETPLIITKKRLPFWFSTSLLQCINPYAAGGGFDQYKWMQKSWKMIETLSYGYSSESIQRVLYNEYQDDRVKMVFKILFFGQK